MKDRIANFKRWFLKWRTLNVSLYFKDLKITILYWLFALVSIVFLFQKPILDLLNNILINPVISFCPQNFWADLIFFALLGFSFYFFFRQLSKHIIPTANSLVFSFCVVLIYILIFKSKNLYSFYHFTTIVRCTYATIFLIYVLIVTASYKSYLKPLSKITSQYSLLDDNPSIEKYEDVYGRDGYATFIAKHIADTSPDVSFAIGIIGDWGSGKSDFMNRVKSVLKTDLDNIILDFNPWRVNKTDAIVEEFFKTLSKGLKTYNQSITSVINDYSNRILKTSKETHYRFFDALIDSWFKEGDIQERYDTINETIRSTSKRITIFIDDVDRLTGKEVMEVLRIIRNSANFNNTFFIVAIDQSYTLSVLKNAKEFANEEEFLKKIFQLTITLPVVIKRNFIHEVKKYLFTQDMSKDDKESISKALTRFGIDTKDDESSQLFLSFNSIFYLENIIDNIRDLKRFCNSFKIAYNILKGEVDLHDLIMLEAIRNKNIEVYNNIRNRRLLEINEESSYKLSLEKKALNKLKEESNENGIESLIPALEFLFTDVEWKNQRKLIYSHNFYIYFSYQLFTLISFKEFNETIVKQSNDILLKFEQWIKEKKEKELLNIIQFLDDFKDIESFKQFIIALLKLWKPNTPWLEEAKRLVVINWIYNQKKYFNLNAKLHKEFLISILNHQSIDFFVRASLAYPFLNGIISDPATENNLFIKKKELRSLIYHLFDQYLNSNPSDPKKTEQFYYLNDYKVVSGNVVRSPPASRRFKKYLLSNEEGLKGYLKILLRHSQQPYNGTWVLEPWIDNVFPNRKIFENKLQNTTFSDIEIEKLKNIILKYLNPYFTSGKKPFFISDESDKKFVEDLYSR